MTASVGAALSLESGMRRMMSGLVVGLALLPTDGWTQQAATVPRIGLLQWEGCPGPNSVFGLALRDLGYTWGEKIEVACRSAEGNYQGLSKAAADLAAQKVNVIVGLSHIAAHAAHRATQSVPIVMIASGDPVRTNLVASLARPGGNVTGVTYYSTELGEKRLQLLKEIVPGLTRVAILGNTESDHVFGMYWEDAARAARTLGLELIAADVRDPRHLEKTFQEFSDKGAQGLLVLTDPMLRVQARRVAALAAKHRLPAMYGGTWFLEAGGLASYSADFDAMIRRVAYYVDRILKGARPATLPIEQPTKFELIFNLKTAKALGLTVPEALLVRADRLIEE
jgi:putative ABC transport system substrate-binding protein